MTPGRRRAVMTLVAVAVLLGLYAARRPMLTGALEWLDVGTPPRPVDCAMVLGGDVQSRPFVAAALVRVGLARKVLLVRGVARPENEDRIVLREDELARQVLLRRGVPEQDVVVLDRICDHTYDEAQALQEWLAAVPGARVAVVTSFYHTRRARWIFDRVLADSASQICFVSAPCDEFPTERWWQHPSGVVAVASEYLKLAFYAVRYGYAGYWVAAGAIVAAGAWLWFRRRKRSGRIPAAGENAADRSSVMS